MNSLEQKHIDAIYDAEYEEIRHSAIYKMDFEKAAKSCADISIEAIKKAWMDCHRGITGTLFTEKEREMKADKYIQTLK